ncbi:hypothetical protein VTK73DRAFT_10060 [Phialemonium thermophilum]|uniref:NADP-dependent oxidoreductase domain-containing protein n=1 Tax=Phialemonium thermophilum TaxID=223376 RepID=A0ABR3VYY1_9PEZI
MASPAQQQPSPLSSRLPSLILGAAGFSYNTHPDPESLPVGSIIRRAFDAGIRVLDTAPFYEPSEALLGKALASPEVADRYERSDYILMTKVGRNGPDQFDYSPSAVRRSVDRSLARLRTSYLDVVFCHDVEFVTDRDVLDAVGELLAFLNEGTVRHVGLSGYCLDVLASRARLIRETWGRAVDVVQVWGQLNLQNTRLETEGIPLLRSAGVQCILNASPLSMGLLRQGGAPQGRRGDFHPAPAGLRSVSQQAADYAESRGDSLAALGLRYALWRTQEATKSSGTRVCTLTGVSTLEELTENLDAARKLIRGDWTDPVVDEQQLQSDAPLWDEIQKILGAWLDWSFTIPPTGWSQELKRVVGQQ